MASYWRARAAGRRAAATGGPGSEPTRTSRRWPPGSYNDPPEEASSGCCTGIPEGHWPSRATQFMPRTASPSGAQRQALLPALDAEALDRIFDGLSPSSASTRAVRTSSRRPLGHSAGMFIRSCSTTTWPTAWSGARVGHGPSRPGDRKAVLKPLLRQGRRPSSSARIRGVQPLPVAVVTADGAHRADRGRQQLSPTRP